MRNFDLKKPKFPGAGGFAPRPSLAFDEIPDSDPLKRQTLNLLFERNCYQPHKENKYSRRFITKIPYNQFYFAKLECLWSIHFGFVRRPHYFVLIGVDTA